MIKSNNKYVNTLLKYIGENDIDNIETYIIDFLGREYLSFNNEEEIYKYFKEYIHNFYKNHTLNDIESLRKYTGISYKDINAILRNNWNYEINGRYDDTKVQSIYRDIDNMDIVMDSLDSVYLNMKVYRGVNIDTFKEYGVRNIEDLVNLKGDYLYDNGYASTSLLKNTSYFNRDLEYHNECNVLIEYLIPAESQDGIPLITDELSYSKKQYEYLINRSSLSKIIDVRISNDKKNAYLKVMYVPQRIWNREKYIEDNTQKKYH